MRSACKHFYFFVIAVIIVTASCTVTPNNSPSIEAINTNASADPSASVTTRPAATTTTTATTTIIPTTTAVPDVELAQLQINGSGFFAELINHLSVPVVFEDQQPSFRFDVYDPGLDEHFKGEEPVNRYNDKASVPCVLYPGETVFFAGTVHGLLYRWSMNGNASPSDQLKITYQSLGVPHRDWKDKTPRYTLWDLNWNVQGEMLNFSFQHTPYHRVYGHYYYSYGTMGLYEKDDHLLGVAIGEIFPTIDTGIADGYWISFDNLPRGNGLQGWLFWGPEDAKTRVDHIAVRIEILPGYDGVCAKKPATATS